MCDEQKPTLAPPPRHLWTIAVAPRDGHPRGTRRGVSSPARGVLSRVSDTERGDARLKAVPGEVATVFQDLGAKRSVLRQLSHVCSSDAVLTSNSSTIPISRIVERLAHRERACNMHFIHPVLILRLVEIMRGPDASDSTVEKALALARSTDREPVVINRKIYGLIVNRIFGRC